MNKVLLGNCLDQMKTLADNSVDSIVTDPPYGLSFMGKAWDYEVPSTEIWREAFRVLKPGGHLLSFFGTRTYHRGVINIENAGFEIRDQIMWIYGSGFPKSHDVRKGIDKHFGKDSERPVSHPNPSKRPNAYVGQNGWKTPDRPDFKTTGATDQAKQWQGWGSALKPANEPIVVARKPLEKGLTVAQNVLKYGTGAINVDESRIQVSADDQAVLNAAVKRMTGNSKNAGAFQQSKSIQPNSAQGRWPANIIFDEAAAEMLDEQSGKIRARNGYGVKGQTGGGTGSSYKMTKCDASISQKVIRDDENGTLAGASRFFYVAKASKGERNAGLEACEIKVETDRENDSTDLANRLHNKSKTANFHPTVKPIKLMEYLIKLVTPPQGTVLDPFMGSGSTGVAAKKLGFNFIGCEMNEEYLQIAEKRIEAAV